jgi:malonyl-CoA O-methyltransferase
MEDRTDPLAGSTRHLAHRRAVAAAFDRAADRYDRHAALEQEVGRRLLERCAFSRREPERILDLGCGTGVHAAALKRRYRHAQVVGLDLSHAMLERFAQRSGWLRPLAPVRGDIAALPFARATADLIFANLVDSWLPDRSALLDEYRRVLRAGGMLLFSTFGPATFRELREAVGPGLSLPEFPDVMEIGDALVAAGFREPVVDMESITLQYRDPEAIVRELESTGAAQLIGGWGRAAADTAAWRAAWEPLRTAGKCPVSFEIVYGTAFGPEEGQPRRTQRGEEATFSVDNLLKSRPIR